MSAKSAAPAAAPGTNRFGEYETLTAAATFFRRRLHQKTTPQRRSRRRYLLLPQLPAPAGGRQRQLELPFDLG